MASSLRRCGHRVIIICASWHHLRSSPASTSDTKTIIRGGDVEYLQLPARYYKGNGLARVVNMLGFAHNLMALSSLCKDGILPKPDAIIPSCVHPFVFPPARRLSIKYGAKLIYEVRDLWPLSLVELAGIPRWHPMVIWMNSIERRAYRQSDAVVSLLPNAYEHMRILGLTREKFNYIPNGVSLEEWNQDPVELPSEHLSAFKRMKKSGKTVVLYAGAHGPPNGLDQILDLASIPGNDDPPYHFILIGDGIEKTLLSQRILKKRIQFVTLLPKVSKPQAMTAMGLADICFFSLRPSSLFRFGVSPNKLADYFMAGKPIISACSAGNDPVADAKAGISVLPYAAIRLDQALRELCAMPQAQREQLGNNGRQYVLKHLEWSVLAAKYDDLIKMISKRRDPLSFC